MRVNPSAKAIQGSTVDLALKAKIDRITRIIAIVVAFLSTFGLFAKILFF